MSQRARREAKKAGAKSRQQHRTAEQHDSEFFDDDPSAASGAGASSGGAAQSAPPPGGGYVLFDGREDLLLYWQSELSRAQKEEALHISDEELGRALQRAAWGHGDASATLAIDPRKLAELRENAELMTAARCIFIDACYAEGKARSMGEAVAAAASSSPQAQADAASLDLILHSILGVIERKVLLSFERDNFYLRLLAIVLFWVWSWSDFGWIVRYTLILALGFVIVAASNAAATVMALETRQSTDPEIEPLSPFWSRVGHGFLTAKRALIAPFDDPSNPILLRARTDIALSALLVIDHASWVFRGRFMLLLVGSLILPSAILLLEKGGGGWNRSIDTGRSARAVDAQGLRWLRVLSLSLSHVIAIYYSGGNGWVSFIFVSGFFFPSATTIALSSLAVVVTGAFILLSRAQTVVLGEYSRRRVMCWAVWIALLGSMLTGHAGSGGWLWYLASLAGLALFLPPLVSFGVQIVFGGLCSLLLSVGLIPVCKLILQITQMMLTKKGVVQMAAIIKGSLPLIWELLKQFLAGLRAASKGTAASGAADFSASSSSSADSADASAASADSNSEMN